VLAGGAMAIGPMHSQAVAEEAARPKFELDGNELKVPGPVLFEAGSDKLKPESEAVLQHVKSYLDEKAYISLMRIEVHTDSDGNAEKNQALSEQRSMSVAKALVAKGISCSRLIPVGFGGTKPVAPNDSPENKAKNRRVTFVNAALRGRPIGGMPVDGSGKVAGDPCK
jgi:OOP family OmpA-OmpF porin